MTREARLHEFFSSFGIKAYPNTSVPEVTEFPWLVYEIPGGYWGDAPVSGQIRLWYHTASESIPNEKVRQIAEAIGLGGKLLGYDGGAVWITRGQPWVNNIPDEADASTKCKALNLMLEDWRK